METKCKKYVGVTATHFSLCIERVRMVSSTPKPLYPGEKKPWPTARNAGWTQRTKSLWSCPKLNPCPTAHSLVSLTECKARVQNPQKCENSWEEYRNFSETLSTDFKLGTDAYLLNEAVGNLASNNGMNNGLGIKTGQVSIWGTMPEFICRD